MEYLEDRALLAADTSLDSIIVAPQLSVSPQATSSSVSTLTPAQVAAAYGITGIKGDGTGQTIAIIDAYDDPNIASDLKTFDAAYGLKDASLTKVVQYVNGRAPAADAGWSTEIALDVEWAHAIAPGASILLVEANTASLSNLLAAVNYARSQASVSVISMSWGAGEFQGETAYDSYFTTPAGHTPISFVAAAGDSSGEVIWPAVSANVLSVGGTQLNVTSAGTYLSESAWVEGGGGSSLYVSEPSYQSSVQTTGKRTTPDVAYDASPSTGFSVYNSVSYYGQKAGWMTVGGTSAGAPQWAALIAIANQERVAAGETTLGNAAAAVYSLPKTDFHDVTSGSNGNAAKTGYDLATGLGSPYAAAVVQGLVGTTTASVAAATVTTTSTSTSGTTSRTAPGHPNHPWQVTSSDNSLSSDAVDEASFALAAGARTASSNVGSGNSASLLLSATSRQNGSDTSLAGIQASASYLQSAVDSPRAAGVTIEDLAGFDAAVAGLSALNGGSAGLTGDLATGIAFDSRGDARGQRAITARHAAAAALTAHDRQAEKERDALDALDDCFASGRWLDGAAHGVSASAIAFSSDDESSQLTSLLAAALIVAGCQQFAARPDAGFGRPEAVNGRFRRQAR